MSETAKKIYKTMSRQELMEAYQTSYPTFRKWLSKIPDVDFKGVRLFTPKEVKLIVSHIGEH